MKKRKIQEKIATYIGAIIYIAAGMYVGIAAAKMMKKYDGLAFDPQNKRFFACPALNDEVIRNLGYENSNEVVVLKGNVCILPSKYMDPLSPGNTQNLLCDDTISIHHYTASWENNRIKLKRKIVNIFGKDKVNRIKSFLFNTGEIKNEDQFKKGQFIFNTFPNFVSERIPGSFTYI